MQDLDAPTTEEGSSLEGTTSVSLVDVGGDTEGGGGTGIADPGDGANPWWYTPASEYVAHGGVDPAIYGLDAIEVGASLIASHERSDGDHVASVARADTAVLALEPHASADSAAPRNFGEWMADKMGPRRVPSQGAGSGQPPTRKTPPPRPAAYGKPQHVAVSPVCDLGDPLVGTRSTNNVSVFNLAPIEATVNAALEGASSSVSLVDAPPRLRPSVDGISPPIKIRFVPMDESPVTGTIVVRVTWPGSEMQPEEARIPVRGRAHHDGTKRHEERERDEARKQRETIESAEEADRERDLDRKIDTTLKQQDLGIGEGPMVKLDHARSVYEASIEFLYMQRKDGISRAHTLLEGFVREQPPVRSSLIADLAWAALDSFSYGLASSISGLFTAYLSQSSGDLTDSIRKLRHPDRPKQGPLHEKQSAFPRSVVGLVGGVVKQGLKKVSASAINAIASGGAASKESDGEVNSAPSVVAFLNAQEDAFVGDFKGLATSAANRLQEALLATTAKTDPDLAVRALHAAADATHAEGQRAREAQQQATLEHWIRYVAQVSLGSTKGADGSPVVDASHANHTAGEHLANGDAHLQRFDGLVDIGFHVIRPEDPVQLISAEIRGVNNNLANAIVADGRLRPGIAVRAYGVGGPSSAVTPLTVVRDESGTITYTDHMGLEWQTPNWFSRRAGRRASEEAQREGARLLLEEILAMQLPIVRGEARGLKTDSKA